MKLTKKTSNKESKKNNFLFLLLTIIYLLVYMNLESKLVGENDLIYIIFLILFVIYIEIFEINNFSKINTYLIKLLPIFFYSKYLFEIYKDRQIIFWDSQLFLLYIRCNDYFYGEYAFKLDMNLKMPCPETIGFGPLSNILKTSSDPFLLSIIFMALIFLVLIFVLFKLENKELLYVSIFYISPSSKFLISTLNPDIIIFIFCLYLLVKHKQSLNLFDSIILVSLCLLKVYPIAILFGYILLAYLKKELKKFYILMLIFAGNLFIFFKYFYLDGNWLPTVNSASRTFGLLSDFQLYKRIPFSNIYSNKLLLFLTLIIFLLTFLYFFRYSKLYFEIKNLRFETRSLEILVIFTPLVVVINLFANYGYKFVFNYLLIFIILKQNLKYLNLSFLFLAFIIPLLNIVGYDFNPSVFSTVMFFASRVLFYFINVIFLMIFLKVLNLKKLVFKNR
jgi:hypothetical protein